MQSLASFFRVGIFCGLFMLSLLADAQLSRMPNTSLTNLPTQPPQFVYVINNAFSSVSLSTPVCIASPPQETNRLFILEKAGNIVVITNLAAPTRTVFMNLPVFANGESGLIGLAFHPGYATNGYFFVFSSRTLTTSQGTGVLHQRISRFQVTATNANAALASSELPLITQRDYADNHNGGDLHFGPDGYLYASVGDGGAQYDGSRNSQTITSNYFSAILRLDVDKRPGNLLPNPHPANTTNYFIPADNPYVGLTNFYGQTINPTNIRTEFYAIGFRNPWRMSFDPGTGFLYVGDVGQGAYEEVDVVVNGGNYGWVYREGLHPGFRTGEAPPGFTSIDPIQEIPHSGTVNYTGNAVIGGVVYRGSRISQLYGAYVFSDNGSGRVWMLRYDGSNTVPFQAIITSPTASSPSAFGIDPRNGDVLIAQLGNNQIGRLDYNASPTGKPLPPTLADTGAFTNLTTLAPSAGIVPYDLNVPFWSDNAIKSRWVSVPNTNLTIGFNPSGNWSFPTGTVWIKHFELELTNGVAASRKRLETRFIVRNTNGIYGITYRWDSATNATLVPEAGLDESFAINDGGNLRTQIWHYPSRSECLVCHTAAGGYGLGFRTEQLNRNFTYGSLTTNQISALSAAEYFSAPVTNDPVTLLALAHATNANATLEFRVRSFLAANCSQCHQPGGTAQRANWDARITTSTANAGLIRGVPVNDLGSTNNFIVAPQSPGNSILLTRISARDLGSPPPIQMPPLASNLADTQNILIVSNWIASLPAQGIPNVPVFNSIRLDGANLIFSGTNGWPGQNYSVLTATNLALPFSQWLPISTNPFNPAGHFNLTNPLLPGSPQLFYQLQLQ